MVPYAYRWLYLSGSSTSRREVAAAGGEALRPYERL